MSTLDEIKQNMESFGVSELRYGLLHGDLSISNIMIDKNEVCFIDFDDCGFGYWLYDLATLLIHWSIDKDWNDVKQSLLRGYQRQTELPESIDEFLPMFITARYIDLYFWLIHLAQDNRRLVKNINYWEKKMLNYIRRYLNPPA